MPIFAFVAALVTLPAVSLVGLSPAFWAIVIAMPVGKIVGITAGAALAARLGRSSFVFADVLVVAGLGGIGFTISLLMNSLAFRGEVAVEGTLAVMVGSGVALALGGTITMVRARQYRTAES